MSLAKVTPLQTYPHIILQRSIHRRHRWVTSHFFNVATSLNRRAVLSSRNFRCAWLCDAVEAYFDYGTCWRLRFWHQRHAVLIGVCHKGLWNCGRAAPPDQTEGQG